MRGINRHYESRYHSRPVPRLVSTVNMLEEYPSLAATPGRSLIDGDNDSCRRQPHHNDMGNDEDHELESHLEMQPDESEVLLLSSESSSDLDSSSDSLLHSCFHRLRSCCTLPPKSLCASAPRAWSVLIPLLCLCNHYLFFVGQTEPMWKLNFAADINVWYNATGLEAKAAYYSLGFDQETHVVYSNDEAVKQFTYANAIQELYQANGIPGNAQFVPKLAAVLLILFSGIWPHLKLCMLSLTWLCSTNSQRRGSILQWLSTLGKWSLADVLVVCVMVSVLNLDWTLDPNATMNGFVHQVPLLIDIVRHAYSVQDVCNYLLHLDCGNSQNSWTTRAKCKSCINFLQIEFDHPATTRTSFAGIAKGVQSSGGGVAQLQVQGVSGIYYFCVAVILSILSSLLVDVFDVRAQQRERVAQAEHNFYRYARLSGGSHDEQDDVEQNQVVMLERRQAQQRRLVADESVMYETLRPSGSLSVDSACAKYGLVLLSTVTSLMVLLGALVHTLERKVTGAIPQLMHDILGIAWDREFSFATLVGVTGAAGGWDWLLMATFALFIIIGPILRAILCVLALAQADDNSTFRLRLHTAIDFIGAFCAWEVVALACYLVSLIMPLATSTIITRPECAKVDSSGSCLEVSFDLQNHFWMVIVGGSMLVFSAYCCHLILPHR
ncbi:hypothetical protein MPSEU_000327900 [Mayamaea pseudoterrestris]|nr:hypothetical protein MPSEU_000327900 [Mayamaea pseudoterrestris]